MRDLKVTVELGFDDDCADNVIDSAKKELRNDLKEVVFANATEYSDVVSFRIGEIVLDSINGDSKD